MSQFKSTFARMCRLVGAVAALTIAGGTVSSHAGDKFTATSVGDSSVVITDGESSEAIEVRIENGDVTVKINGEEIPADRIIQDGDKITILDKDGKALKEMQILMGTADGGHGFAFSAPGAAAADGGGWRQLFEGEAARGALRGYLAAAAGPPPKIMLGVTLSEPGEALETHLKLEPGTTTMVGGVHEGLPAHAAGLAEFDIIVKVDGRTPADPASIRKVMNEKEPGGTIVLSVIHAGAAPRDVTVIAEAYDARKMADAKFIGSAAKADRLLGMQTLRRGPRGEGQRIPEAYWEAMAGLRFGPDAQAYRLVIPHWDTDSESPDQPTVTKKLEQRIEDLDKRIAELDAMIRKLVDEKAKSSKGP